MSRQDCGGSGGRCPREPPETLDGTPLRSHNGRHERPFRNLRHLPGDYSLAHRWLRPSFLKFETKRTPGQQVQAHFSHAQNGRAKNRKPEGRVRGTQAVRYADTRKAGICPARSLARAHVCVRTDGLRFRPYRQCAPGHRVRRAVPAAAPPLRRRTHVTYVRNITDVDDKINARAARGISGPAAERGDPPGHREDRGAVPRGRRRRSAACARPSSRARPSTSPRCGR